MSLDTVFTLSSLVCMSLDTVTVYTTTTGGYES